MGVGYMEKQDRYQAPGSRFQEQGAGEKLMGGRGDGETRRCREKD